jgi:hypothetical protein
MANLLGREAILTSKVPTREVEIPEWDGVALIRSPSTLTRMKIVEGLRERDEAEEAYKADQAKPVEEREGLPAVAALDTSVISVMFAIIDENLQPIFGWDDYDKFLELSYPTIQHIYGQMIQLEARLPVPAEEQKKSSGTARKGASSSGSRSR